MVHSFIHSLPTYLVFDGGGIQHGDVVYCDPLPDDPLTSPLELELTVAVGEVEEPDGVLGWEIHSVRVEIEEKCPVHCVAEVTDVDTALHTIFLPVILNINKVEIQVLIKPLNLQSPETLI